MKVRLKSYEFYPYYFLAKDEHVYVSEVEMSKEELAELLEVNRKFILVQERIRELVNGE